jgi:hypothetical protein
MNFFTGEFADIFRKLLPINLAAYPAFLSVCRKLLVLEKGAQ